MQRDSSEASRSDPVANPIGSDDALIATHIVCSPNHNSAADARLVEQGVPVWIVIDFDRSVNGDTARVVAEYGLSEQAVRAARGYYRRHQAVIDARIALAIDYFTT